MSDSANEFITQQLEDNELHFLVARISWPHPHMPELQWRPACKIPAHSTEQEINKTIASILADSRYFATCRECGETKPLGHMHSGKLCHSCAENNHGVCY